MKDLTTRKRPSRIHPSDKHLHQQAPSAFLPSEAINHCRAPSLISQLPLALIDRRPCIDLLHLYTASTAAHHSRFTSLIVDDFHVLASAIGYLLSRHTGTSSGRNSSSISSVSAQHLPFDFVTIYTQVFSVSQCFHQIRTWRPVRCHSFNESSPCSRPRLLVSHAPPIKVLLIQDLILNNTEVNRTSEHGFHYYLNDLHGPDTS